MGLPAEYAALLLELLKLPDGEPRGLALVAALEVLACEAGGVRHKVRLAADIAIRAAECDLARHSPARRQRLCRLKSRVKST